MVDRSSAAIVGVAPGVRGGMAAPISLLELLLPAGFARHPLVIGSNCPPLLRPEGRAAAERPDLIVLAPTMAECRTRSWLKSAVQVVGQALTADGLAYILAPPYWRAKITGLLRRHSLTITSSLAHLPNWASSSYLVPLTSRSVRYTLSKLPQLQLWKRQLALIALGLPRPEKFLRSVLPSAGLVARRPGARPLFDWLFLLDHTVHSHSGVVVSTSWRGQAGAVVLHRLSDCDERQPVIAKVTLGAVGGDHIREAAILARLGSGVRSAGARIPGPLLLDQIGGRAVLLETAISGSPLAARLASRPDEILDLVQTVAGWLDRWHRATMIVKPLDRERLHQELLAPAVLLAPLIHQGKAYQQWLEQRCAAVTGVLVALVATHNDLTMRNVLVDEQGRLGIIDWETGRQEGLPLADFCYAATDAVAATDGYADRLKAFEACFAPNGIYRCAVVRLVMQLSQTVGIAAEIVDLCFHACWLHHAANEHRASGPLDPRPFRQIVQWLALQRSKTIRGWMDDTA